MRRRDRAPVALGLAAGVIADVLLADPARWHPVAGFGRFALAAERRVWRPSRAVGLAHLLMTVAPIGLVAHAVQRPLAGHRGVRAGYVGGLTWLTVGATGLRRVARGVEDALVADDLAAARNRIRALCGRDPATLDATGICRAVIESVAENTSDAGVAPLVWGALGGPVGLVAYRAVNTLDAMVGHRSARYERFGWAAARLDDVLNLLPARLTGLLAALLAPTVGGRTVDAIATWRADARAHPSPNAGVCEAAFAGALGVRLGGPTAYTYGVSDRPWLGAGRAPEPVDVERAVALSQRVVLAAAAGCTAVSMWRWSR